MRRRVIADMPVHVRIDRILRGRIPRFEGFQEFVPVLRGIDIEEWIVQRVVQSPLQRNFASLPGDEVSNDRAVARDDYIDSHVGLTLHMDDFFAMLGFTPFGAWLSHGAARSFVLSLFVELFDEQVLNCWSDIRKTPRDALVMTNDDKRQPRQGDTDYVVVVAV